jgi:hypothetical protein
VEAEEESFPVASIKVSQKSVSYWEEGVACVHQSNNRHLAAAALH